MLGSISLSLIYFAEAKKEGAALARGETEVVGTSLLYTAAALAVILKPAFVPEGQIFLYFFSSPFSPCLQ